MELNPPKTEKLTKEKSLMQLCVAVLLDLLYFSFLLINYNWKPKEMDKWSAMELLHNFLQITKEIFFQT